MGQTNNNKTSTFMIPRIKKMSVLDDYILFVEFDDGYKVLYDVKDDIKTASFVSCISGCVWPF